jgi:uncharacterized membrane protein
MGAFAGAVIGSASYHTYLGLGAGMIGAVLGTLAGAWARQRFAEARSGQDRPGAILEDVIAVGGGFLIVYLAGLI